MDITNQTDVFNHTGTLAPIHSASQLINIVLSIVTVGFNSIMALYLILNRRRFKDVMWYQLMTFSISDGLAGVSPSLFLLFKFESVYTSTLACGWIVLIFNSTQLATVLNLCQLSARRFYVLRFTTRATTNRCKPLIPIAMGIASWSISCVFVFPFAKAFSRAPTISGCASPLLFGTVEQYLFINLYYTILLVTMLLSLNVFYFITACILRYQWRRVIPSGVTRSPETAGIRTINTTTFRSTQHRAWVHLCIIVTATNLTMWPYIIVSILMTTETVVYDPLNMPMYDVHMLCLNSLLAPILNVCFVREMRMDLRQSFRVLTDKLVCFM